jgi:cbb3-type cytochrome oxidase subunit 1
VTRPGGGGARPHWLAALGLLIAVMLVVPVVARFY